MSLQVIDPRLAGRFNSSGYLEVYNQGGADALNELLRARHPVHKVRANEIARMRRSGFWEVADGEDRLPMIVVRTSKAT